TESGLLGHLFDETVALAIKQKLVSQHTTLDGTLVQANASHKSFVPMEVFLKPEEYKRRIRSLEAGPEPDQDQDRGNPTITFRGESRSHQTHVSTTDPDAKLANKGNGTAAMVGYTVNGLMENRHRLLLGINVETFRGPASETEERWLRFFGQNLSLHKWCLAVSAYAAVDCAGLFSQYTPSGVRPSSARCGLI